MCEVLQHKCAKRTLKEGEDFREEPELKVKSATRKGEAQDAEDDTNHEYEDTVEVPDVRCPSRICKPPKHLIDYVVVDDVEAVDQQDVSDTTTRCLEYQ